MGSSLPLTLSLQIKKRETGKGRTETEEKNDKAVDFNAQGRSLVMDNWRTLRGFDEFDGWHYSVETKLINLAKSLTRKMKSGQEWNSDYNT